MSERIQKLLATAGIASRRAIETLMAEGRVTVNGRPAELGQKINHDDHVRVDGRLIPLSRKTEAPQVLLYRKRVGELVTREDPEGRKTVFRKLPELEHGRWIAVGRLDINTSGLLLLTNDGELARRLMHPSFEMRREYAVRVLGTVDAGVLARLKAGVELEDGFAKFETIEAGANNATLGEEMDGPANSWWAVTVKQGRNRVVRRLLESQNLQVSRLMRVCYGPISLGRGIKSGSYREATEEELQALLESVQLQPVKPAKKPRKAARAPEEGDVESEESAGGRRRHLFRDLDESKPPERSRAAHSKSRPAGDRADPRKPRGASADRAAAVRGDAPKPRVLVAQPTPREARFPVPAEGQFRDQLSASERTFKPRADRADALARASGKPAGRAFARKGSEFSPKRSAGSERPGADNRPRSERADTFTRTGSKPAGRTFARKDSEFAPKRSAGAERSAADSKPRSDRADGYARSSGKPAGRPFVRKDSEFAPKRSSAAARPGADHKPRSDRADASVRPGGKSAGRPFVRKDTEFSPKRSSASERPGADGKPRAAKPSFEKRDFKKPESKSRGAFTGKPGTRPTGKGKPASSPGSRPDSRGPSKGARSGPPGRRKPKS